MLNLKSLLGNFPEFIQYVIIIGLVLVILYVSLILTRFLGSKMGGDKVYFDNPEEYDKTIPDLFGARKSKRRKKNAKKEDEEKPTEKDNDKDCEV